MPTPLEKTEALLKKVKADLESIQAKKEDILKKEKQAVARLEKIENARILQLVNLNKINSDMLKTILMGKTAEQQPASTPVASITERNIENADNQEDI